MKATEAQILAGAKAMHHAYEMRAERRHNGYYTRQRWEDIDQPCRDEFINYVTPALDAALKETA